MRLLTVRHATTYRYTRPVSFGQHRLMLRPRDSHDLRLVGAELTLSPPGNTRWMHDVFGNSVALVDFSVPAAMLSIITILVWIPAVIAAPRTRMPWTALFISWAITAAVWVVAQNIRVREAKSNQGIATASPR